MTKVWSLDITRLIDFKVKVVVAMTEKTKTVDGTVIANQISIELF